MMSFQFAGQSTFTALGRSKQAVFFSLFRKVVIVIPLIYILPHIGNLGVNGVFMAEPVSNFIGGIACFATMYFTVYRKLSTNIGYRNIGIDRTSFLTLWNFALETSVCLIHNM